MIKIKFIFLKPLLPFTKMNSYMHVVLFCCGNVDWIHNFNTFCTSQPAHLMLKKNIFLICAIIEQNKLIMTCLTHFVLAICSV